MNEQLLYQWAAEITSRLGMKKWQGLGLALFSLGVALAERCTLSKVAERLGMVGKADSVERRLQRVLANEGMECVDWRGAWVRWVMASMIGRAGLTLLVDETKLGNHLGVMLVGVAYRGRCIPLLWRCYRGKAYPVEGQVKLIAGLLHQLAAQLPAGCVPLLQADRGIGTSPALVDEVVSLGWHYLFRVQGTTRFRTPAGDIYSLESLAQVGQAYHAKGQVFKDAGWREATVHVQWAHGYDEPWCLITNHPTLLGTEYAQRNWQEQSFRDFKSGGWHWGQSQVWQPAHAECLLLVVALTYAWVLSLGTLMDAAEPALRQRITRGSQRHFSLFREGLRYLRDLWQRQVPITPFLCFIMDKPHPIKLS